MPLLNIRKDYYRMDENLLEYMNNKIDCIETILLISDTEPKNKTFLKLKNFYSKFEYPEILSKYLKLKVGKNCLTYGNGKFANFLVKICNFDCILSFNYLPIFNACISETVSSFVYNNQVTIGIIKLNIGVETQVAFIKSCNINKYVYV